MQNDPCCRSIPYKLPPEFSIRIIIARSRENFLAQRLFWCSFLWLGLESAASSGQIRTDGELHMKKAFLVLGLTILTIAPTGCSRGPIRQFFRGSSCNACQPPMGRFWGANSNTMTNCEGDNCDVNGAAQGAVGTGTVEAGAMETGYYDQGLQSLQPGNPNCWQTDPNYNGTLGNAIVPPSSGPLPGPNNRN